MLGKHPAQSGRPERPPGGSALALSSEEAGEPGGEGVEGGSSREIMQLAQHTLLDSAGILQSL